MKQSAIILRLHTFLSDCDNCKQLSLTFSNNLQIFINNLCFNVMLRLEWVLTQVKQLRKLKEQELALLLCWFWSRQATSIYSVKVVGATWYAIKRNSSNYLFSLFLTETPPLGARIKVNREILNCDDQFLQMLQFLLEFYCATDSIATLNTSHQQSRISNETTGNLCGHISKNKIGNNMTGLHKENLFSVVFETVSRAWDILYQPIKSYCLRFYKTKISS